MTITPLLTLLYAAHIGSAPSFGADTTRYQLQATLVSSITPEGEIEPQEQTVKADGWLRIEHPSGAGTVRAVIDSGHWNTTGFEMLHEVSTDALRGMELRTSVNATGAPISAVTGAGEHPIAGVFQDLLSFVRTMPPVSARTDTLVTSSDGDHWRVNRMVAWTRSGDTWQGTVTAAMAARDAEGSSGSETGTISLKVGADGSLTSGVVDVQRALRIATEHGSVVVRQTIQGSLTRAR